jgi:hypothetical protein
MIFLYETITPGIIIVLRVPVSFVFSYVLAAEYFVLNNTAVITSYLCSKTRDGRVEGSGRKEVSLRVW